jgi:hypothetical protein
MVSTGVPIHAGWWAIMLSHMGMMGGVMAGVETPLDIEYPDGVAEYCL